MAFSEEQLTVILMDLFLAGAETTSTTLTWSLINLMQYPEKQKKIHDEIDNILGDEVPNLDYKGRYVVFLDNRLNRIIIVLRGSKHCNLWNIVIFFKVAIYRSIHSRDVEALFHCSHVCATQSKRNIPNKRYVYCYVIS